VLGLVRGKAVLVNPTHCIGHGACETACPFDAITLVLGTERRGVEIPRVGPDFQTVVPGVFVAGELGGMGLIRNAVARSQGSNRSSRRLARSAGRCARRADRRRRTRGPVGIARRETEGAPLHDDRAGVTRRDGRPLPTGEDRDDVRLHAAALRHDSERRDQQGVAARALHERAPNRSSPYQERVESVARRPPVSR
jgi:ferredoxin